MDQSLERMMEFGLGEHPPLGRMVNRVMFLEPQVGTTTVSLDYTMEFVDWEPLEVFEMLAGEAFDAMNDFGEYDDPV